MGSSHAVTVKLGAAHLAVLLRVQLVGYCLEGYRLALNYQVLPFGLLLTSLNEVTQPLHVNHLLSSQAKPAIKKCAGSLLKERALYATNARF
jgi:hypothetical protein